jgi:hypothetical protein
MSIATNNHKTMTLQKRSSQATRHLFQTLGLEARDVDDLKFLSLAIIEMAAEEVARNPEFAARITAEYRHLRPISQEMSMGPSASLQNGKTPKKPHNTINVSTFEGITPLKQVDMSRFDYYGAPDPYLLEEIFGFTQVKQILPEFALASLLEMASVIQEKYPGTKPSNKKKKESVIAYILQHLPDTYGTC